MPNSNNHTDSDFDQISDGWNTASEDEVEQLSHADNGHFCDLSELPAGADSHEEKAKSSNKLGILVNDARGNTKASVSDLGGSNRVQNSIGAQPSSDSYSGVNGSKNQNGQNTPKKAQVNPIQVCNPLGQDIVSRVLAQDPLESIPYRDAESTQSLDHLQNVETLICVTSDWDSVLLGMKSSLLLSFANWRSKIWGNNRLRFLSFPTTRFFFTMNIVTFNTCELGDSIKRRELRRVWFTRNGLSGRPGGLLCIWDSNLFEKTRVIEGESFLGVEGLWGTNKATCCFVNVYGPCNVAGRAKLWEDLSTLIGTQNYFFCLGGDFNCVRGQHERQVEFTDDEIREAISSCASDKASGPDGFNFHFIKSAWGTVGTDMINFIKEFHHNGKLVKGINFSYITLVPKKKNPTSLKEFRPICTVRSIYKILAKVLTNRLKKVIGKIISTSQSAFIKGRQLVDCAFTLNEIVHDLKTKRRNDIIFKADFEKAFGSVDWGCLHTMHSLLGFGEKWRSWIKEWLISASISVVVNGNPTNEFNMQRCLRQGDLFSPYLFLIAAKGFHAFLLEAKKQEVFKGVVIDEEISISHLQFADDTALICNASINSNLAIKYTLRWFEIISGLKINFNKSVLFGVNVDDTWINMAASALKCKVGKTPFIYLGLLVRGNPHHHSFWKPMIDKFRSKLASWKGKLLSIDGRITLLTSVLSALPPSTSLSSTFQKAS
ncbi:hypothetical protein SLEP1_g39375 [Rubroshorea leprosula]|uniref:Reverse transcriptase domain-containing protein n=1 Tax=Rubroshorea leprosula TaxID=152421 RepID=A0AAV5L099_9ROSI|nr:hypothetical protein SLEP1_g39375 [Rubroshorea leprosula]